MRRAWICCWGSSFFWAGKLLSKVGLNIPAPEADRYAHRSHYHRKDKPYASVFSQLAISLIFDLSLHKPPGENSMMACFKSPQPNAPMPGKERTMEDRRAILACFHVTSQYDNLSL